MTKQIKSEHSPERICWEMSKGAGIAAAVFFGPVLAIYLLYLLGTLLPEESREAPDPTPDSFSMTEIAYRAYT